MMATVPHVTSGLGLRKFQADGFFVDTSVHRKPETSIVRKIYKWQPYVTRPVGRPKHRWDDDVRNDLRRMKLLKWSEQAQDRIEWKKNCGESQDST